MDENMDDLASRTKDLVQNTDITIGTEAMCQVFQFTTSHRRLCIRVETSETVTYLYFTSVLYFSGPTSWRSGNFRLASVAECISLFRTRLSHIKLSDQQIVDNFGLYTVAIGGDTLLILCSNNKPEISRYGPYETASDGE